MITSRYLSAVIAIVVMLAVALGGIALCFAPDSAAASGVTMQYESSLFGTDIISVQIEADPDAWQTMLDNATAEEFIPVDITVNGTKFEQVGIRPKGNSSLTTVASSDSDRYSFRIKFDEYVDGQTCFGLDQFVVNNIQSDATYMKEYLSYELMNYIGVQTPLYGYADIQVNGEDWGFYLAIESYRESFLERVYGDISGNLYNVKMTMGGKDMGKEDILGEDWENQNPFSQSDETAASAPSSESSTAGTMPEIPSGNMGGFGGDGSAMQPPDAAGMMPEMPAGNTGGFGGNGSAMQPPDAAGMMPEMPSGDMGGFGGDESVMQPPDAAGMMPEMPTGNTGGFGGNGSAMQPPEDTNISSTDGVPSQDDSLSQTIPSGEENRQNRPAGGFGGGMGSDNGGSLIYTDDSSSSYSSIFENAVLNHTGEADYQRVIRALKALAEGEDPEEYFDVDQIIRYFAAHTVLVNLDSYISGMQQNYFLYEKDGIVSILPWDYNLAFGGFQSGSASSVVNFPIDTPLSGVSVEDRPLLAMILNNETYRETYHSYLQQIVDGYYNSGLFESNVAKLTKQIAPYVEKDPSAFYDYSQFEEAIPMLVELCKKRAASIEGQLNGSIPSSSEGQAADPSSLIPADGITLSTLGAQGGGEGGMGDGRNEQTMTLPGNIARPNGETGGFDREMIEQILTIVGNTTDPSELTDEQRSQLNELGITDAMIEQFAAFFSSMANGRPSMGGGENGGTGDTGSTFAPQGGMTLPEGTTPPNAPGSFASPDENSIGGQRPGMQNGSMGQSLSEQQSTAADSTGILTLTLCTAVLLAGIAAAFFYKRSYR